jgi:hypothetical protein
MTEKVGKQLSYSKRLIGIIFFVAISIAIPFLIIHFFFNTPCTNDPIKAIDRTSLMFLMFLGGCFFLFVAISVYMLTLATKCFTFNFHKPFFSSFKKKLYIMHNIFTGLAGIGIASFVSTAIIPILMAFGISLLTAATVSWVILFILTQLLMTWIAIWKPMGKLIIKRRLVILGINEEEMEKGIYIGISNPTNSSFKKMTYVQEDVGMLWLHSNELIYKGDKDNFNISRENLIEVERIADFGGLSAFFGDISVIIRYRTTDGTEQRIRLHCGDVWTLSGIAKESDMLSEKIIHWKEKDA